MLVCSSTPHIGVVELIKQNQQSFSVFFVSKKIDERTKKCYSIADNMIIIISIDINPTSWLS